MTKPERYTPEWLNEKVDIKNCYTIMPNGNTGYYTSSHMEDRLNILTTIEQAQARIERCQQVIDDLSGVLRVEDE